MYEFIPEECTGDLQKYIRRSVEGQAFDLDKVGFGNLKRILFSIRGYEGLKDKKLRKILINTLSEERQRELVRDLKKEEAIANLHGDAYTLALLPWRKGTKIVDFFRDHFYISDEYLPVTVGRKSTHEILLPIGRQNDLFDYQEEVRLKISNFISSSQLSVMVQLPTGSGKTRTSMSALVDWLNEKESIKKRHVIWLAHTQELCQQASEAFRKNWLLDGRQEVELVELWGDAVVPKYSQSSGFWVAGYVKFVNAIDKLFTLGFEELVLVIDEAHKSIAPSLLRAIDALSGRYSLKLIGLTATPGRASSDLLESKQLSRLFSSNLITATLLGSDPIGELQARGILAPIRRYSLQTECDIELDLNEIGDVVVNKKTLSRLAANPERNRKIVEVIRKQVTQQKKVIVFACSVDHARTLSISLAKEGVVACAVDCEMSATARKLAVMSFKNMDVQVLLNYGVLSTGLDVPDIGAVVIARPTASIVLYSQMIGRGMRGKHVGGTAECTVIDILDNIHEYGDLNEVYNYFENYWKK